MSRFIRKGTSKIYFLPTVAAATTTGPTSAEITAGTDLTPSTSDVSGWTLSNSPVATPDMSSTFTKTIAGEDTTSDSSLTFYEDNALAPIEAILPKGTIGFIYFQRKGAGVSKVKSCDLFNTQVTSKSPAYSAGNDPATFMVSFAQLAIPNVDLAPPV